MSKTPSLLSVRLGTSGDGTAAAASSAAIFGSTFFRLGGPARGLAKIHEVDGRRTPNFDGGRRKYRRFLRTRDGERGGVRRDLSEALQFLPTQFMRTGDQRPGGKHDGPHQGRAASCPRKCTAGYCETNPAFSAFRDTQRLLRLRTATQQNSIESGPSAAPKGYFLSAPARNYSAQAVPVGKLSC